MRHSTVTIFIFLLLVQPVFAKEIIDSLQAALATHAERDTTRINLLNKLGYEYWILDPAQSELLGKQALHLADSLHDTPGKALAHRVIGVSLWERRYGMAESYSNLGRLFLEKNELNRALTYFRQSAEIRTAIEDREGLAMCDYFTGKIYLHQQQYALASKYLHSGKERALEVKSLKWLTSIYQALKDVEIARGNYQQAVAYYEAYTTKKDSLFNLEKSRQLAEMHTRFETLQKEQQLQAQQQELVLLLEQAHFEKLLKNALLIGIVAIILITYLIISRQRLKIKKNRQLLMKSQEILRTEQALAKAELENARLQELKLLEELETKNKQLTSYSLNFIQKNELMEELKANLHQLQRRQNRDVVKELNGLNRLVENSIQIDKDWENFKRNFEDVHKDFYRILKDAYPDLTNHELKLCTLLKLNMNLKEAASIMGISPESIKKARHRLRKKFNLLREENLIDHIILLEKQANVLPARVA